ASNSDAMTGVGTGWGGEFSDRASEAEFQAERFPETRRHARNLFMFSAVIGVLLMASDWRGLAETEARILFACRAAVILGSLLGIAAVGRARGFPRVEVLLALWQLGIA